jgi:eukaryotic translation initiation factor 2C
MLQQFGNYGFGTVTNHQCRNIILSDTSVDGLRAGLNFIPRAPAQKAATVVFLFLPKKHLEDYQCFKSMADRDYGFHTICITEASMVEETKPRKHKVRGWIAPPCQKDLASYFGNVMMKVNLKFGGINHTTDFVKQTMQDTMVLGA